MMGRVRKFRTVKQLQKAIGYLRDDPDAMSWLRAVINAYMSKKKYRRK